MQTLTMLYIIGLGLSSIEDISLTGLNAVKKCSHIFLDAYTSILTHGIEDVSKVCGKEVKLADREFVEQDESIISLSKDEDVAFLVVGDPLGATTHTDLIIRAIQANIQYKVIHNASILTGVGCCGLQLYRYGETVSIPIWDELGSPESFYTKIMDNYGRGLHTLCLLDIKVKERSVENLLRDRKIYEPPRYMCCSEAAYQILEAGARIRQRLKKAKEQGEELDDCTPLPKCFLHPDCLAVCIARVGAADQSIVVTTMGLLRTTLENATHPLLTALGAPLHSLVIPGKLHPLEEELLLARGWAPKEVLEGTATSLPFVFPPGAENNLLVQEELKMAAKAMFARHDKLVDEATG
ncbi:unnamed protein product [Schistocephalus solidus]|uniref:diphthine methyl ester synthase n=2 Tax=Schistocephalus solidus TaxID=70667 RepID=A0A183TG75_SCHSO|nr:unnamed protein product [Schistocephalus solidus]